MELPDIAEIQETLAFIKARDPQTARIEALDSDAEMLTALQARVESRLGQDNPADYPNEDELSALLGEINDEIDANATKRKARSRPDQP